MKQLVFEHHPFFLILCLLGGLIYAFLQYQKKGPWSPLINKILFTLRAIVVFLVAIFLVAPILKQILNETEKPTFVIAIDNSASLAATRDSTQLNAILNKLKAKGDQLLAKGFEVDYRSFNDGLEIDQVSFDYDKTNISTLLESIESTYEGRNLDEILLVSDGIYNAGLSPTFGNYGFPVNTLAIGDTIPKSDISIHSLLFNKLSYQGNKFPIVAQLKQKGFDNQLVTVTVRLDNEIVGSQQINLPDENRLKEVRFLIDATNNGFQRYSVTVSNKEGELTYNNNRKNAYVEVIEGKEKIALFATSPHPDIKALRSAIESNTNYEFEQFVLSNPKDIERLKSSPKKFDLVIYHQLPDRTNRYSSLLDEIDKMPFSKLTIVGPQTELRSLNTSFVNISTTIGEYDNVNASFNANFENFNLSDELQSSFQQLPPITVPFGRYNFSSETKVILFQQVGSITTTKPLLAVRNVDNKKSALFMGTGLWKWKLTDYANHGNNNLFNELVTKLVQYLSTKDDKRKFKVYPFKNEYSTGEAIVFETEVYNDLYEEVFDNKIELKLTGQDGNVLEYDYITSKNNTEYKVTGIDEGVYEYEASTTLNGNLERVRGQLIVKELNLETVNLTADLSLMKKLAEESGGQFFKEHEIDDLGVVLEQKEATGVIHSSEELLPFINLKWILFLLIFLISSEWFLRKYHGTY